MNGIINLYKPKGITSSDAVTKVKKILGIKTVGHMGTLDPAGEGVLLIGVGKAARLFNFYLKKDKLYEADFTFGYETNTLDGDGKIIRTSEVMPTTADIERHISSLVGKQMQIPPAYSAKSVGGIRAYSLARQGKEVVLQPSAIEMYGVKILSHQNNVCKVLIHCSSGTYIRSVCRDLANLCGSVATMTAIKRLKSGEFKVEDSVDLERLQLLGGGALISLDEALKSLIKIEVGQEHKKKLDNGVRLTLSEIGLSKQNPNKILSEQTSNKNLSFKKNEIPLNSEFTLYSSGILYGIAEIADEKIVIKTYLKD